MSSPSFASSSSSLDAALSFLSPLLTALPAPHPPTRPSVVLTYAQSLDTRIAGAGRRQLRLSGRESMGMTHRLRSLCDGICVGVGTMLSDDPQLNARDLPSGPLPARAQPIPIILDPTLRTPTSAKLLQNARAGTGRTPLLVSSAAADPARRKTLEEAGAEVLEAETDRRGRIKLPELFERLAAPPWGLTRIMVEGGSTVIRALLTHEPPLVDLLIVTIAPTLVGAEGVPVAKEEDGEGEGAARTPLLEHVKTQIFGQDAVIACRIVKP